MAKSIRQKLAAHTYRRLPYFKQLLKMQVQSLKDYVSETDFDISSRQSDLDKDLKQQLGKIADEEEKNYLIDWFLDSNLKYYDEFPKLFYTSSYLIVYSFFESSLSRIARLAKLDINQKATIKITASPNNNHIAQSKKFLNVHCRVPKKVLEFEGKLLDAFRQFRNFIAHSDADLRQEGNKAKIRKVINRLNKHQEGEIFIKDNGKCEIQTAKLILTFIDIIEKYMNQVIDSALLKAKRAK